MLKDTVLWIYWHPFRAFLRLLPPAGVYALARTMGAVLFVLARGKRQQLEETYGEVFGTGDPHAARTAVRKAFADWQQTELEVLLYDRLNPGTIDCFVRIEGREHLDRALQSGKGALLLFAHFGANQMVMPAVGYKGYKMNQLSAPPTVWVEKLPNRTFSPMDKKALDLRWKQELSLPVKHINIFGSLKGAFVALRNNEVLGVAIDGGGGKNRIEVDFIGKRALFPTGAIELAMRATCPVLPVFMIRSEQGPTTMVIEPALDLLTGDDPDAIRTNIMKFLVRFEPYVLKYPSHYLMFLALRRFMAAQGDTPFFIHGEKTT